MMSGFPASTRYQIRANVRANVRAIASLLVFISLLPAAGHAQDAALLACADVADRDARLSCLEAALETAVRNRDAATASPAPAQMAGSAAQTTSVVTPIVVAPTVATPSVVTSVESVAPTPAPTAETATEDTGRFNLFGLLDRQRDEQPEQPVETMDEQVTELEYYKPDVVTITLSNGQIWRQLYASRFNLRVGDDIHIYRSSGNQQYRLEAERFNGIIRVERLR